MATLMTLYGPDVSSYQGKVNWKEVKKEGFDFAIVKCTEGNNYLNPYFVGQIDGAKAAGLLVAVYHYVRSNCSAVSQAAYFASMCDTSWPVILDQEANSGNEALNYAVYKNLIARGYQVVLNYFPKFYWKKIGSPHIRFGPLWKSWYPDMVEDYASSIYKGKNEDGSPRIPASAWYGYGGQSVALRQFTSSAKIAGKKMDCSAYEGTLEQLTALFNGQNSKETDMSEQDVWVWDGIPCREPNEKNYLWQARNALGTTVKYSRQTVQQQAVTLQAIKDVSDGVDVTVDTDQIVKGVLTGLDPDSLANAIKTGLGSDVAQEVLDSLGEKLSEKDST